MLPFQATSHHQLDSQEDTLKNSSYFNPELISLIYPLEQYMHTQSTASVI